MGSDTGGVTRRALDRVANALAGLACLFFVLGLADSPRVALAPVSALAVPESDVVRDARLVATVVERGGAPIDGATVTVFWERDATQYFAGSALTDAEGRASLEELPRGSAWVLASAKGFARASARRAILGGTAAPA